MNHHFRHIPAASVARNNWEDILFVFHSGDSRWDMLQDASLTHMGGALRFSVLVIFETCFSVFALKIFGFAIHCNFGFSLF